MCEKKSKENIYGSLVNITRHTEVTALKIVQNEEEVGISNRIDKKGKLRVN